LNHLGALLAVARIPREFVKLAESHRVRTSPFVDGARAGRPCPNHRSVLPILRLMRSAQAAPEQTKNSPSLFVSLSHKAGVLTVRPVGPNLNERESMIIASVVKPSISHIGGRLRKLVLDFSDVVAMSSLGLGLCIELRNAAEAVGAGTVVFNLSSDLTELFRMMKVDRLYTMTSTAKELSSAIDRTQ
jgi:anti-anti-sigma factor